MATAVSADGTRAVTGRSDGTVLVWDVDAGLVTAPPSPPDQGVASIATAPDARTIVVGTTPELYTCSGS